MGINRRALFIFGIFAAPIVVLIMKPSHIHKEHVLGISIFADPTSTPTTIPAPTNTPTPTNTPATASPKKPLPAKTPTPPPVVATSAQLDEWFTKYSNHYSVDRNKLWWIAVCESNLKSHATNGDYAGLYQFATNTWKATRRAMNENPDPTLRFHPEEAIKTAAFKISTMGLSPWPNCNT